MSPRSAVTFFFSWQASQKWRNGGFNEKIAKHNPVLILTPDSKEKTICSRIDMQNVAAEKCKWTPGNQLLFMYLIRKKDLFFAKRSGKGDSLPA